MRAMTVVRRAVHVWVGAAQTGGSSAAAREVLARYGLTFARDARGRPGALGSPSVGVSVAHTDGIQLVALGAGCRVGVDVERLSERGVVRLPAHALTSAELEQLERGEGDRIATFVSYWTRKEALLKAAGLGLAVEPRLVELGPAVGSSRPLAVPDALGPPGRWVVAELSLPGLAAAVAAEAPAIEVRLYGALPPFTATARSSSPQALASAAACASAL
jgi:4'-phosphopantetheinyl transferase